MENYILKNENAIYYECSYSCDNVLYLKLGSEAFFITDSRYMQEAQKEVRNASVIISANLIEEALKIIKKSNIKSLVYDGNDFTYSLFSKLKQALDIELVNKEKFSQLKRMIKSDDEITILHKAAKLGRKGFERFAKYLQKNGFEQSEKLLTFKAYEKMTQKGQLEVSFDPIVAINENAANPHAKPTDNILRKNDLLLVDMGIKYKRYCSDRTSTSHVDFDNFSFGREQKFSKAKHQKIYDIVLKAQENAISKARIGMKARDIDKLTRDIIDKAGYGKYYIHSTGHGVGLDIHEYPFINAKSEIIIEENMVFTIEPGIYLPNEFGVRIEDTVAIINSKAHIL